MVERKGDKLCCIIFNTNEQVTTLNTELRTSELQTVKLIKLQI